jgi:hypothetical protein
MVYVSLRYLYRQGNLTTKKVVTLVLGGDLFVAFRILRIRDVRISLHRGAQQSRGELPYKCLRHCEERGGADGCAAITHTHWLQTRSARYLRDGQQLQQQQ